MKTACDDIFDSGNLSAVDIRRLLTDERFRRHLVEETLRPEVVTDPALRAILEAVYRCCPQKGATIETATIVYEDLVSIVVEMVKAGELDEGLATPIDSALDVIYSPVSLDASGEADALLRWLDSKAGNSCQPASRVTSAQRSLPPESPTLLPPEAGKTLSPTSSQQSPRPEPPVAPTSSAEDESKVCASDSRNEREMTESTGATETESKARNLTPFLDEELTVRKKREIRECPLISEPEREPSGELLGRLAEVINDHHKAHPTKERRRAAHVVVRDYLPNMCVVAAFPGDFEPRKTTSTENVTKSPDLSTSANGGSLQS